LGNLYILRIHNNEKPNDMAEIIRMPRLSDTMTEGVIVVWRKKVGDAIEIGDILADVETDKATMEIEAYNDGVLLHVGVEEGQTVAIDTLIAVLGEKDDDIKAILEEADNAANTDVTEELTTVSEEVKEEVVAETIAPAAVITDHSNTVRLKASPLAKKMAADSGIDISHVQGSGDEGRIVKRDVEAAIKNGVSAPAISSNSPIPANITLPSVVGEEKYTDVPVSQMRKTIAKRLSESKFTAPHFYLKVTVDMDKAMEARKQMNEVAQVKLSFNDLVVKAAAVALKQHPTINSAWMGDKIRTNEHVNIGVAVAVPDGLLVPVIRYADTKSLSHISVETKEFAVKAKNKELQPKDWEGSTFTISNLGMFGIDEFTAIINTPDACILAVGGINQVPVVKNGDIVPGNTMKLTLSCDHRLVDGASGAAFLNTLKGLLEEPVRLLV
jgi:pyruvate dehydrogenase E2 component (dihydrolipoamide acetyltransferase)